MSRTGNDVERCARYRVLKPLAKCGRIEGVVSAPENRRGYAKRREPRTECGRGVVVEPDEMRHECITSSAGGEGLESRVECETTAFAYREAADDRPVHEAGEERGRHSACERAEQSRQKGEACEAAWGDTERGGIDQREVGDPRGRLQGDRLGNRTAQAVPDDRRALNAEIVEKREDGRGVRGAVRCGAGFGSPEARQVTDDESVLLGKITGDGVPEATGHREPVEEDDRDIAPSGARRVVVEASAPDVDELTSHCGESGAFGTKWYPLAFPRGTSVAAASHPVDWQRIRHGISR